jgi:hypothetical protein
MEYQFNDGGRSQYFKGTAGDCVTRAIAIATGRDYKEVYDRCAELQANLRKSSGVRARSQRTVGRRSARNGVYTNTKAFGEYMTELGFEWVSFAKIGAPSKVKLDESYPSQGRSIARIGRHLVAVIDGVVHDSWDCRLSAVFVDFKGTVHPPKPRMVYGYWKLN